MRQKQLEAARKRLEARRKELAALIQAGNAGIAEIRAEREIEFADGAQSAEEQERIALVGAAETAELARVDGALARIDTGTYGMCAGCGEPIEQRRLEASPYAVQCAGCAGAVSPPARR
jgi:RNA polymerase-binding protein DksA